MYVCMYVCIYLSDPARSTSLNLPIVTTLPPPVLCSACSTIIVNTAWLRLLSYNKNGTKTSYDYNEYSTIFILVDAVVLNSFPLCSRDLISSVDFTKCSLRSSTYTPPLPSSLILKLSLLGSCI